MLASISSLFFKPNECCSLIKLGTESTVIGSRSKGRITLCVSGAFAASRQSRKDSSTKYLLANLCASRDLSYSWIRDSVLNFSLFALN